MEDFKTIAELIAIAEKNSSSLAQVVINREKALTDKSEKEIRNKMAESLKVMRQSIKKGLTEDISSMSGLTGGDAQKVEKARKAGKSIAGDLFSKIIANTLAVSELNAAMGKIVACPTAGSCGILPGSLTTIAAEHDCSEKQIIDALFVASGFGIVIAKQASVSGAAGGCQAECGSASSMTAAAITYLLGGTKAQVASAAAIALKNLLGLVCDPVAGLVEVPCIKRNTIGSSNALTAAEMALAGVESVIPVDEVIVAMKKIGDALPSSLKETSQAGLAATPTANKIKEDLLKNL
ncbi:L-serine ammonia-lyase, iron-sulfur-dependent, subunit alpha [Halanaerobium praevalens]|uniref:L-serine dehydratase n=1 Tax=Halanaerobium praevalens (strain ATCC 33744 / DSM 2228 / GSL) TaxID=572479 RepID=E3DM47_HALPG|nr:L-serine ammonia-lyase, iron-sulfur-dependent, subunit alpha [Halanaerobium praevalens]ADO77325.1 L-serine ammonia-lyase [Halanaerobium praevalens DSM 2228]